VRQVVGVPSRIRRRLLREAQRRDRLEPTDDDNEETDPTRFCSGNLVGTPGSNRVGAVHHSLKVMLAMWRLAAQEKSVSVLRRFKIESESEGVSISGTLPASFLRSLSSQRAENH